MKSLWVFLSVIIIGFGSSSLTNGANLHSTQCEQAYKLLSQMTGEEILLGEVGESEELVGKILEVAKVQIKIESVDWGASSFQTKMIVGGQQFIEGPLGKLRLVHNMNWDVVDSPRFRLYISRKQVDQIKEQHKVRSILILLLVQEQISILDLVALLTKERPTVSAEKQSILLNHGLITSRKMVSPGFLSFLQENLRHENGIWALHFQPRP